jgi:hypothetical protein
VDPAQNPAPGPGAADDYVYLLGRASLREYLTFMATEAVGGVAADQAALAGEWRAAQDRLKQLRRAEEDWADDVRPRPLPTALEPLAAGVAADPIFQTAFAAVPSRLALVELDRLVVTQTTIHLAQVARLTRRLGPTPSPEDVFRLCLPADHPTADVRVGRVGSDSVVFVSGSDDLRFQEAVVLAPGQLAGHRPFGPVAGVVGLVVGFGSGYLNVVACEGRLVLNNGYHRAYALRELGVTHAPAVVQEVRRADELGAAGGAALRRNPDAYLRAPRPPVLKDYFDPELRRVVPLVPKVRHVRVRFTIEEVDLPL